MKTPRELHEAIFKRHYPLQYFYELNEVQLCAMEDTAKEYATQQTKSLQGQVQALMEINKDLQAKIERLEKPKGFCTCRHGFKKKNYDQCDICGGKWKGRPI